MGKFIYGQREIEIEDRTLAHVKIVILTKLRRNESFAFNVVREPHDGSGRSTLWIHPAMQLEFSFYGSRSPDFNREWVEGMLQTANSPEGLRILPEHPE